MIVTTADLYTIAYGKYAIGAYNLDNLEQTLGLFKGSLDLKLLYHSTVERPSEIRRQRDLGSHHSKSRGDIPVCIGSFSSITPNSSLSDRLAQLLWKNTPSLSPARTKHFIQPDSYP
jgi:hypothetical protein